MKFDRYAALLALLVLGCSSQPSFPWENTSFDRALARAGDKMVMLDFYTDT